MEERSRSWRRPMFWPRLCGAALLASSISLPVLAAPDEHGFELDGNMVSDGLTDWESLFDVVGSAIPTPKAQQPAGHGSSSFTRDFEPGSSADSSTFSTGSKDILNIGFDSDVDATGKTTGWQCGKSNNIGDKVDLLNTYATSYLDPQTKHTIVFFGLETASNEGTRNAGFWFLKDGTVGCSANSGKAVNFAGTHMDGDILVTAEYTGTGGVSLIKVFRWNGGASGSLSEVASGQDCSNAAAGDSVCGSTNGTALRANQGQVPWLTRTKTSNPSVPGLTSTDLDRGEFFEGGLDLTQLGLSACFGKYLANTRSSATPSATLFDFAVGNFATCSIGVSKSCDVLRFATDAERTSSGKNFYVEFRGAIQNTGGGALPANTPVAIVDDAGTPNDATDDISISQTLVSGLAPGTTGPQFSGSFLTNLNPPTNTVRATATVAGTAINAVPFSIACTELPIRSALTVTKDCGVPAGPNGVPAAKPGTELVANGNSLTVRVNVSGEVCYSDPNATATVPYLDVSAGNQLGLNPVPGQLGTAISLSKTRLLPGDCAKYEINYTPATADGSFSPASNAAFTDTVSARGTHPALSAAQRPFASDNARCPLCPCTGTGCTAP